MPATEMLSARPFELAPPLPPRPIQWRRARRLLLELIHDPEGTDRVFQLFEAMGGRGDERTVQQFAARPEGRRLFAEKPSLLQAMSERDRLQSLPDDSFGRAYLSFAKRNGFDVDGLLQSNQRGLGELNRQLDEDRLWFFERANLMHDLWHVLTGYDTDPAGEAALLAFSHAQGLASRTVKFLILTMMAIAPKRDAFSFQRFVVAAWRRGRSAAPLFIQRYEELLRRPLDEVRRELHITPIHDAHPGGLYHAQRDPRDVVRVAA